MRCAVLLPVRNDGHDDVEHDEGAEEDEGDEVEVGDGGPAAPLRVRDVQLTVLTHKGFKVPGRDIKHIEGGESNQEINRRCFE